MKKTTIKSVRALVTREINSYRKLGYKILPYTASIINTTNILVGKEFDDNYGWFVYLNDDYKQIIKKFIDDHYGLDIQEKISFDNRYNELKKFYKDLK